MADAQPPDDLWKPVDGPIDWTKTSVTYAAPVRPRTRGFGVICGHRADGLWWFRIFGWGLHWKDTRKHGLTFSERLRVGWGRLRVGRWMFRILRRSEMPK